MSTQWFIRTRRIRPPRLRLFCFPYAGGGASIFRPWAGILPDAIELLPVQLPGRETRFTEAPLASLAEVVAGLADAIAPLLDRPYATFGHSLGTLVSYELILELRRRGLPLPAHVIMSGRGAPHIARHRCQSHRLPDAEFIEDLRSMRGTPEEVLNDAELMRLMLPVLRADFAMADGYELEERTLLPGRMSVYGGLADLDIPRANLQAWQEYCAHPITLRMLPGGHFFLNSSRPMLLQALARDLHPLFDDVAVS